MEKKHIFDISERSETPSRNSIEPLQSLKDDEHFWENEYGRLNHEQEKLFIEYEKILSYVAELKQENADLRENYNTIVNEKELEKQEIIEQMAAEMLKKVDSEVQERRRHQSSFKLSICLVDSISIHPRSISNKNPYGTLIPTNTGPPITPGISKFKSPENLMPGALEKENQLFKNKLNEIDAENSDLKDEVVGLNRTIIDLKQELSEIRGRMQQRGESMLINFGRDEFTEGSNKLNRYKGDITDTPRGFISTFSDRQSFDNDVKLELDSLRRRNMDLDKALEDIKEKEFQANFFYREEQDKIIESYKNLYQLYLRKKNELENKENQVLEIYKNLRQVVEEEGTQDNSNDCNFVFWFLVAVLLIVGLFFSRNLFDKIRII